MTRARWAALVAVLVLLAGSFAVSHRGTSPPGPDLAALRSEAGLAPCPSGLSPQLPDLVLPCVGTAGTVPLRGRPARPTVVNVWGTWCPPCREEVPLLQALHARTDAVDVVGVLTEDTVEHGLQFAVDPVSGGMTYPSVVDDEGTVMRAFGPGPPITLFVTADGRIAHTKVGRIASAAELDGLVATYLGVRS